MSAFVGVLRLAASAVVTALFLAACAPRPEPDAEAETPGSDDTGSGRPGGETAASPVDGTGSSASDTLEISPGVSLRLAIDPATPTAGEPLEFVLVLRNGAAGELVIDFPDGQRFDFEVSTDGSLVWRWAADMFFPQVLGRERIAAGDEMTWTAGVSGGFPAGSYAVRATLTSNTPHEIVSSFEVVEGDQGDIPE
ncbi:MAG: BsuPI-related putative proteinase inhibitor [Gemmatimonadota bacterium]|nr:BsuPI-related putative proteinase inhibitor [Gemmatimonadota bacterium]